MNPRVWAFDLELNQPSNKIIQIGGVIGELHTGRILTSFNYFINPHETLNPRIIELTKITQAQVDNGIEIGVAAQEITQIIAQYHVCRSPVVWGNGDLRHLKAQAGPAGAQFQATHRELDIKTIHQFLSLSKKQSMRGGLETSLNKYGLKFKGTPHNALDDAINTFLLAHKFFQLLSTLPVFDSITPNENKS